MAAPEGGSTWSALEAGRVLGAFVQEHRGDYLCARVGRNGRLGLPPTAVTVALAAAPAKAPSAPLVAITVAILVCRLDEGFWLCVL